MEVKAGYKQTEVGVIPEEWIVETIGDLIEEQVIIGHLDGNHGELYPRSHEFKPYGVPYIGANDFDEGDVNFKRCKFLSAERAAKFRKGVARDGDVLFAHNATVGPVALLRTNLPFVILSTTATYFRCNPERLNNSYLKGALQSSHFVRQYQAVMAQSTRFQVPITAQRKLSLVIAPLPEQRAIAAALSDVDALLGGLDRLIAKKRDLKQAAMQQLLTGQTRLPGFHGEWLIKTLGEVATIKDGTHQTPKYVQSGVPFYSVEHITSGDFTNTKFISDEEHRFLSRSAKIEKGDILMTRIGSIGECKLINWAVDASFYVSLALLKIRSGYSSAFIADYSNTAAFKKEVELHSLQSAIPKKINLGPISNVHIELPPTLAEQTAIAEVLSGMAAELAALELRREKTRDLKQAMMQELLTGKTRLVHVGAAHA